MDNIKLKALLAMNDSYKTIIDHLQIEKNDIDYKINKFMLLIEVNLLKINLLIDVEIKNKITSE
jgi:hypothetical protein